MPKKTKIESTEKLKFNIEDVIFALDIGTRTVVGIVGYYEKDCFRVIAAEVYEHKSRAMMDGQIHDISKVAEVVTEVKNRLEKVIGFELTKVSIAAAGRVLKTSQTKLEYEIEQGREITAEMVGSLEVDAIQKAQQKLDAEQNEEKMQFYCVGYSVINYFLNDYVISALVGHKGKKMGAEVLATFLPHVVVDSLYTVMSKVGLEVISLTLEPIAAINVTIPKDLRLLNLVLVDIGAGTSDIAITKNGSVVAYGMVPIAGDEITERIAQELLVDFNTAEKIKLSISSVKDKLKFTDILGKKNEIDIGKLIEIIEPSVNILAKSISDKILEFNQKAPNAVFLIGGGSQVPGLPDKISENLDLHIDRVAVRGRDVIHNIKTKIRKLTGPEAITPFGIAMMAHMQKGQDFMSVTVNGERVRLFNSKQLTVADSLILVGFNPDKLIGRTGKALKFTLNGKQIIEKGEHGTAAEISVNNTKASLESIINIGDFINVTPAVNGKSARRTVGDYIKNAEGITVSLNGNIIKLTPKAYVNGIERNFTQEINENDKIIIDENYSLKNLLSRNDIDYAEYDITVNGSHKEAGYILCSNDQISYTEKDLDTQINFTEEDDSENESIVLPKEEKVSNNAFVVSVNGEKIILDQSKSYIFVDIFSYINFDLTSPKGNIILKLNGRSANFTDPICPNDSIEVYWESFKS